MTTKSQHIRTIFLVWLAAVTIACLSWWIFFAPRSFDSAVWKSKPTQRTRMVNDLLSRRILIGKSREEVVELLGEDPGANESRLIYRVGSDSMIDDTRLEVQFADAKCRNVQFHAVSPD